MLRHLLYQTCDLYRITPSDRRLGRVTEETVIRIGTYPCRLDTVFIFSSRAENVPEEYIGRLSGILFLMPEVPVRPRDFVVINSSEYDGKQFDVQYIDSAPGYGGLDHFEAHVFLRDENHNLS